MTSLVRQPIESEPHAYLGADEVIDFRDASVLRLAGQLSRAGRLETARACFLYVRDEIEHSGDYRRSPTTCAASEVLSARTGYCYAKSHLLVALLRANGLPAGLCYQRLTVEGAGPPYCLHGLCAVELPEFGWYAIDPRGNKAGVQAEFDPPHERLAFAIVHPGERDFPLIYPRAHPAVLACLRAFPTWDSVLANLPDIEPREQF